MKTVRAPQDSYTHRNYFPDAPHRFVHFRPYISKNGAPLGVLVGITSAQVLSVGFRNGKPTILARMPEAPETGDLLAWDGIRWKVTDIRNGGKVVAVFSEYEETEE